MVSYYTIEAANEVTNFQKEITNMMHGFGDNPNPNPATVVLVESIVLQQLRTILQEALNISIMRGSNIIKNFDIIYLMKKNKPKLKRLHEYQVKLDLYDKKLGVDGEPELITGMIIDDDKEVPIKKKRDHTAAIKELDEMDEVSQIKFDVIDYLRKVRAAKITETMPFEKYEAYHKARCSSFRSGSSSLSRNYNKLDLWVNPNKDIKISQSGLEVLCFLAYETVAEIVDSVFLIRQDAKKKSGDPFSKFEGGHFCNPASLTNAVYIKSGYEGVPAITVAEVREVLRRYFAPRNGMNGLFYRNMSMDLPNRFIAI